MMCAPLQKCFVHLSNVMGTRLGSANFASQSYLNATLTHFFDNIVAGRYVHREMVPALLPTSLVLL